MCGVQRVLRLHDARVEIGEIDGALCGAFWWIQVFWLGTARDLQQPADVARVLEGIEERDLAGRESGWPLVLQSKRCCGFETTGLMFGVVEDPLFDLAWRQVSLRGRVGRFHAVDDIER